MSATATAAPAAPAYERAIARLSAVSVSKHFDAYEDVAWDAPENRIELDDPRWERSLDDPLGATEWYRSLPQPTRARLGLHFGVTQMKVGLEFESVLKRGLLEFAATLPQGAPEFRYAYHEVIEEAQHSLMFNEFVNRSGLPAPGLSWWIRRQARYVAGLGRTFPALFFIFVLGGEAPIDHAQREALAHEREPHPLTRRIMQIHVTEEARHLSFAEQYLRHHVPRLSRIRRWDLAIRAPLILSQMAGLMMRPSGFLIREYAIPREVVREAYDRNPTFRAKTMEGLESVRTLCHDIGIIGPRTRLLWRALGLWPAGRAGGRGAS